MYLSAFNWPIDRQLLVIELTNKVVSAKLLATGTKQKTSEAGNSLKISVQAMASDPIVSVIWLEVKGKVKRTTTSPPEIENAKAVLWIKRERSNYNLK